MAIEPDTKDWTWVLERRCDECGFDASTFPHEEVADLIRVSASAWRDVLAGGEGLRERPSPDWWSPLEYACHVRDVFRIYDERLSLMLDDDDPTFPNWDQDATAVEDRYGEQDPRPLSRRAEGRCRERSLLRSRRSTPSSGRGRALDPTVLRSPWTPSPATWSTILSTTFTTSAPASSNRLPLD